MRAPNSRASFTSKLDGLVLRRTRARREPRGISSWIRSGYFLCRPATIGPGNSAWTSNGALSCSSTPEVQTRRSASVTCANSSTPLGTRKHLNPNTPLSHSGRSSLAFPGTTPPQKPTSTQSFPAVAASFSRNACRGRRCGNAVERHFDQSGDSASRRSTSGRRKTFPFRAARLVDVNVGVDDAWHDDGVLSLVYDGAARCSRRTQLIAEITPPRT